MPNSFTLSSSILSADFSNLADQIRLAEQGGVDWIHIDVMDGHFVPNITMGPFIVETCRRITNLPLDVHLMIEKPENHIEAFIKAGANTVALHVEGNPNIHRTVQAIRSMGAHPGIVINPGTPVSAIDAICSSVDYVLVMSVNPGFSGQEFIPETVEKIRAIRSLLDEKNPSAFIQVDGGVTAENIDQVYQAGARCFVCATAIFKNPAGITPAITALREAVH
jgi:ribulose-phosphate 3-epimerase